MCACVELSKLQPTRLYGENGVSPLFMWAPQNLIFVNLWFSKKTGNFHFILWLCQGVDESYQGGCNQARRYRIAHWRGVGGSFLWSWLLSKCGPSTISSDIVGHHISERFVFLFYAVLRPLQMPATPLPLPAHLAHPLSSPKLIN